MFENGKVLRENKHYVILIVMFFILIKHETNEKPITKYDKQNKSTDLKNLTKHVQCSSDCQKQFLCITILNGEISCDRDIVHVVCQTGFEPGKNISVDCDKVPEMLDSLQCTESLWSKHETESQNKLDVLIVAGGEEEGKMVSTVEVFPPSPQSSCRLPNLPKALKWGAMGMLGETLLVCGGQNEAEQPSRACWTLDSEGCWKPHHNLTRPRSQSASTVSEDGSLLHILSGYGTSESGRSIYTMQSMGLEGPNEEHEMVSEGRNPYHSRLASAVTLTSGDVLVTGGRGTENNVYLLTGQDLRTWVPRQRMMQARCGHSSIRIMLGGEEHVMVAGGWGSLGLALDNVELYSVKEDSWQTIQSLPSARVDFTLQVQNSKITAVGGYHTNHSVQKYPKEATISWSSEEGWSQWVEEKHGSIRHRNGFMAAKVSLSWVKQMC